MGTDADQKTVSLRRLLRYRSSAALPQMPKQ